MKKVALVATLGVALSGCATVIKGGDQSINISTPPTTGAMCVLSNIEGNWTVISPGSVTVEKSKEDAAIHCTKRGWQDAAANIPSGVQGWTLGNIILGGSVEYPHSFQVPMRPIAGYVAPPSPAVSGSGSLLFGITGLAITRASTAAVGMSDAHGVWIESITPSSPADAAGLKPGDVIQSFDGRPVNSFDDLGTDIAGTGPGTSMTFGVWRNYQVITLTAVVSGHI